MNNNKGIPVEYKFQGTNTVDVVEFEVLEVEGRKFLSMHVITHESTYQSASSSMTCLNEQVLDSLIEKLNAIKGKL